MFQYKLTYFDARGLAEAARVIFALSETCYEDVRLPLDFQSDSPPLSPEFKATLPWGQIPILEFNGNVLSQSGAICRFLANKFNLVGENEVEKAKCDEIVDAMKDFQMIYFRPWFVNVKDAEKQKVVVKTMTDEGIPFTFKKLEEIIKANPSNSGFLVGANLTWADVYVVTGIEQLEKVLKLPFAKDYPNLQNLVDKVFNNPKVQKWHNERPKTVY